MGSYSNQLAEGLGILLELRNSIRLSLHNVKGSDGGGGEHGRHRGRVTVALSRQPLVINHCLAASTVATPSSERVGKGSCQNVDVFDLESKRKEEETKKRKKVRTLVKKNESINMDYLALAPKCSETPFPFLPRTPKE